MEVLTLLLSSKLEVLTFVEEAGFLLKSFSGTMSSVDPIVSSSSSKLLASPIKKVEATKGGVGVWHGASKVAT